MMLMDEIYMGLFGDHFYPPEVSYQQQWAVKPDIFKKDIKKKLKPQYMNIVGKHQYQGRNSSVEVEPPLKVVKSSVNQDIRYASQPRTDFGSKKMSIKKKPIMVMESTLEPDLDIGIKVILAENIMHPNRVDLKESAFVLNDMLNAIDKG